MSNPFTGAIKEARLKYANKEWFNIAKSGAELLLLVLVVAILNPSFLSASNIKNLLDDLGPTLIMAIGAFPVILIGSTDLSIGAVASIAAVAFCRYAPELGWGVYPLVLGIGAFSGFAIGYLNARLKVPSFISSLAFMSIWSSLALVMTGGKGSLSLAKKTWYLTGFVKVNILPWLPLIILPALLLFCAYYFVFKRTGFGKQLYAIGANERAGYIAGCRVVHCKTVVFTFAGMMYAFAGILYTGKLLSGSPDLGNDFTLLTIAAVALGGTSLSGGKGNLIGACIGACIAVVITNGMTMIGVSTWWQRVVFGSVILVAAYISLDKKLASSTAIK